MCGGKSGYRGNGNGGDGSLTQAGRPFPLDEIVSDTVPRRTRILGEYLAHYALQRPPLDGMLRNKKTRGCGSDEIKWLPG